MKVNSNIGMLVCSYYPQDPRVRREAEALVEAGYAVDVVCLRRPGQAPREEVGGVSVYRVPMDRRRAGKLRYVWDYLWFEVLGLIWLTALHAWRRYRVVHVHNMPDVLVFCAIPARLAGARVVLDLHDPSPEMYQTKFGISPAGRAFRAMAALERLSIRVAHLVFTPNVAFRDRFVARGCPPEKIHILMNSPQEEIFNSAIRNPQSAFEFRLMFHGGIYHRHGLDLVLDAIGRLEGRIPRLRFDVYGEGDWLEPFLDLVRGRGLGDRVRYHGHVPLEQIAAAIPAIDLGVIPNRLTPFTEINLPTRIFEYLSAGKPVVVPRTRGILDYFPDDSIFYFDADSADSLAVAIARIHDDPARGAGVLARATAIYRRHAWKNEKRTLVQQVNALTGFESRTGGQR
ncbi:MAG: glycosyltransferase family 4 protein [Candidatus Sumerlaeia bacterium]